jgi:co-chaperonin GroES (HSP10)
VTPFWDYLILERQKLESKSIIIPEDAAKAHAQPYGVVRSVGPQCDDCVKDLVGKQVVFKSHAGNWMKDPDGNDFYPLHQDDILCVVD